VGIFNKRALIMTPLELHRNFMSMLSCGSPSFVRRYSILAISIFTYELYTYFSTHNLRFLLPLLSDILPLPSDLCSRPLVISRAPFLISLFTLFLSLPPYSSHCHLIPLTTPNTPNTVGHCNYEIPQQ
jgi:hypothetical protein